MHRGNFFRLVRIPPPSRISVQISNRRTFSSIIKVIDLELFHCHSRPTHYRLGEIKLCDFGVSAQLIDSTLQTFIGTRSYMSVSRRILVECLEDATSLSLVPLIRSLRDLKVHTTVSWVIFGLSACRSLRWPLADIPFHHRRQKISAICSKKIPMGIELDRKVTSHRRNDGYSDVHGFSAGFGCYKGLAIFELMEWIVNETPPSLPRGHFSSEFSDFIDRWWVNPSCCSMSSSRVISVWRRAPPNGLIWTHFW